MNITAALTAARQREPFLIDGIVSASSTLVFAEPKAGKGFLVSGIVAALTGDDADFLGRRVVKRVKSPAICWTDDDGATEYAERIASVSDANAWFYPLPMMRSYEDWVELHRAVMANGHDLVVVDNMTQAATGNLNEVDPVRNFFAGVRLFTRDSIPVIVVAHSSEKFYDGGKTRTPAGHTSITAAVRWIVFLQPKSNGEIELHFRGNSADSHSITVDMPERGIPAFEVVGAAGSAEKRQRARHRAKETLDQRGEIGQWIVEKCQGKTLRQVASLLAERDGKSVSTHRNHLSRGAYGVVQGGANSWMRFVQEQAAQ